MTEPQWYQPPGQDAPFRDDAPLSAQTQTAGFGIRAGARIIDTVLGMVLGLIAGVVSGVLVVVLANIGVFDSGAVHRLGGLSLSSIAFSILGTLSYHTIAEGLGGASIGKLICGLRVLNEDDRPCSIGGAFVRSLAYFVDALVFGLVAYSVMSKSPRQQRLGDRWGGTVVVEAKSVPASSQRSPVLGVLVACAVWTAFIVLSALIKAM